MNAYTIKDFNKQFLTDDDCLEFLKKARWPNGVNCEKCHKVTNFYHVKARKTYACEFCGTQISPTADTIFHKSDTSLRSWFHAMFLMTTTKTGISAKQLQREIGVTYKTAWRMFTQIRKLMDENVSPLMGCVEVDETYIGGRKSGKRGRGASGKTVVIRMVERNGSAIATVIPNAKSSTLFPLIERNVAKEGKTMIFTDEYTAYTDVEKLGYGHEIVQHSAKQYVNGAVHVNTAEALWSTIKRGIDGVNHHVDPLYLQGCLDSYLYRYNHRRDETPMFLSLLERVAEVTRVERTS